MTNATFFNFSDEPFTGYWNGKPKTFKAHERMYMPAYLAEHFAKHLTNRELIRTGHEVYVSPKDPGRVPQFMDVFNKAFIRDEISDGQNELDAEIAAVQGHGPSMNVGIKKPETINRGPAAAQEKAANTPEQEELDIAVGPGKKDQIINPPDGDDDDESNFEVGGKK